MDSIVSALEPSPREVRVSYETAQKRVGDLEVGLAVAPNCREDGHLRRPRPGSESEDCSESDILIRQRRGNSGGETHEPRSGFETHNHLYAIQLPAIACPDISAREGLLVSWLAFCSSIIYRLPVLSRSVG